MNIGIDCRLWNETGLGRYIRNVVYELSKKDTVNTYYIFLLEEDFKKLEFPKNFIKVRANIRWHTFAEQLVLPFIFYSKGLDILHVPHFNVPILYFKEFVATIHDLTILRVMTGRATTLPYFLYFIKHLAFGLTMFLTVVRAKKLFTVSFFVKKDLISTYKIDPKKVVLTPCAVSEEFKKVMLGDILPKFQKYSVAQPYLFYVGNAHPHKNLENLIRAFEIVAKKFPDLSLVLGGSKKFFYERLESEWSSKPIFPRIKFIGFVDDPDLPALYSGAAAFINPSMYEGFGIQILEAFACGTKVVCSNTTSLPEIAGDGAFYFDPLSVDDIASKITLALNSDAVDKIDYGYNRIKDFSWEVSAQNILDTYENSHSM
jgi:glycosyltransferase involved in cell wall biosynthesis